MIPKECKRLAEVDFPIVAVSKHAVREQEQHDAHPKVLHMWWARRPLAACRAMLLGLLLPDPCDEYCPEEFKQKARELLPKVQGEVGPKDEDLRKSLLKFIGDFANWDLSSDRTYLELSRELVKAAHPEETPLVVDPFAGGGSIPLEALRLGADAFASDLNPVACLILKVLLEDIPRRGSRLVEDLRRAGDEITRRARRQLDRFYPPETDGALPIAYLWARTVRCESPHCGAEIPLTRSFWLSKNVKRRRALRWHVNRVADCAPAIELEIFAPTSEADVPRGTVSGAKAKCLACPSVLPPERVRAQLRAQRGGADVLFDANGRRVGGARLLAVVTLRVGDPGRRFRLPTEHDYEAVRNASEALQIIVANPRADWITSIPEEPLPPQGTLGFRIRPYGMTCWGDLFTPRQKLALLTMTAETHDGLRHERLGTQRLLGLVISKLTNLLNAGAPWKIDRECPVSLIAGQRIPPVWDWCEAVPISDSSGSLASSVDRVAEAVTRSHVSARGSTRLADAAATGLPDASAAVYFTDPPYYNAVPYADLSDFYFVWLKRLLGGDVLARDPFDADNPLTPKRLEAVQDESKTVDGRPKDRGFFESRVALAFAEGRRVLNEQGMGCIVFAHKTTEGWEALLGGLAAAGWVITASWPIATEMRSRLRARESAALATSVHLVCRPRSVDAPIGDWGEVHRELPRRVAEWMERLQAEHVRGADLVFACIGPALEIYSRYSKVVDAEDRQIPLGGNPEAVEPHKRGYLAYVWETVGRAALEQVLGTAEATAHNGAAGALEEDARLTALFLWTLQSTNGESSPSPSSSPARLPGRGQDKGEEMSNTDDDSNDEEEEGETTSKAKKKKGLTLVFDVVRRFAQPLGIHLDNWEDRIIETEKGIVRLLPVAERGTQLFGQDGADLVAERLERQPTGALQLGLFPDRAEAAAPKVKRKSGKGKKSADKDLRTNQEATTLDRVHAAMLLQASGRTNALRALLRAELDRGPDFLRLANALSALYPKESEEKRLLDAMLLAVPR